jgi:MFS family permease
VERRGALLVLLAALGVFFAGDDQTSVVAILPKMIDGVGVTQDEFFRAAWIVNGYILGYVVAMPLMGRVADVFGHARVFALALVAFCAGSAWVALSQDLTMLSFARAGQAVGAGALLPVSLAIVATQTTPARRALGLGMMAAAAEAGGLIGPLWGGGLAEVIGWRGVFWINLPMCLPVAFVVWRLAGVTDRTERRSIDFLGAALLGASLTALTVALTDDPVHRRETALTVALYGGAVAFLVAFVLSQLRSSAPMVELARLARARTGAALLVNALIGGALIVAMVNVPLFTSVLQDGSPLQGGLRLMPLMLTLALGALAGGVLTGRFGRGAPAVAGLALAGAGFIGMSRWAADASFLVMAGPLLVTGLGVGVVFAPLSSAVLQDSAAGERATLASLLTVARLLGALVGVALLTTRGLGGFYQEAGLVPLDAPNFVDRVQGLELGSFQDTFLAAGIVCFAAILPAILLNREELNRHETNS